MRPFHHRFIVRNEFHFHAGGYGQWTVRIQRLDIYNKNQITPGENGNVFNTAEEMAALLREEAALTPEQRALRRQKVTAFTQRYGEKEFIRAVLNVYERAMAEYKAKMKIKAKAKSKGVR